MSRLSELRRLLAKYEARGDTTVPIYAPLLDSLLDVAEAAMDCTSYCHECHDELTAALAPLVKEDTDE